MFVNISRTLAGASSASDMDTVAKPAILRMTAALTVGNSDTWTGTAPIPLTAVTAKEITLATVRSAKLILWKKKS